MKPSSKPAVPRVPRPLVRTILIRLAMAVVLGISVWLALWSYFKRFQPVALEYLQKTAEQARLSSEVQRLERDWNAVEAARVETQYAAARGQLLSGSGALADWEQQLKRETLDLALTATPRLGPPEPCAANDLRLTNVTVAVDLQPAAIAGTTNGPYHRLLGFTRLLQDSAKRTDLVALEADGRSNSVEHARAVLRLWSGEEGKP